MPSPPIKKISAMHSVLRLFGFSLVLFLVSCANQATVVELEDYTEQLQLDQRDLQKRLKHLEGQSRGPSVHVKSQQTFSAGLVAQLSDIEADVREFTGRVDEAEHKLTKLNNKVDTESFRTKTLLERIAKLEQQLTLLEINAASENNQKTSKSSRPRKPKQTTGLSPTEAYNLAYNDYLKGNYAFAIDAFDAFIKQYPNSVLVPQAHYWKGESFYSEKSYWKAIRELKQVIQNYPESEKIAKALLKIGFAYFELDRAQKGKEALEKVLDQFPQSNEAFLAEDKLSSLR